MGKPKSARERILEGIHDMEERVSGDDKVSDKPTPVAFVGYAIQQTFDPETGRVSYVSNATAHGTSDLVHMCGVRLLADILASEIEQGAPAVQICKKTSAELEESVARVCFEQEEDNVQRKVIDSLNALMHPQKH